MKYKFVLDVKGLSFNSSTYYRQSKESGVKHGENKIKEIQSSLNGHFNKQHKIHVYEKDHRGVYMIDETIIIEPLKG